MTSPEANGDLNNIDNHQNNGSPEDHNVDALLESEEFKREIHRLVSTQLKAGVKPVNAIQQLSDLLIQHAKISSPNGKTHVRDPISSSVPHNGNSPMIPINDLRGQEGTGYSKEEKLLRCKLAALYRLIDMHGWNRDIYSHNTVRVSQTDDFFLINPFGLLFHEITASSLVKIKSDGTIVDPGSTVMGVNKAGWVLHSALHNARDDIICVMHLHVPDCIAVSCLKCGLLPLSHEACQLLASSEERGAGVSYHDFFGILVNEEERKRLADDLGPTNKVMFLRNHGIVVCGSSVEEAWKLSRLTVTACQIQMRMIQLGGESVMNTDNNSSRLMRPPADETGDWGPGELEFEAMMRLLDNGGYRTGYVYKQPNLLRRQQCPGASEDALDAMGFEPGHFDYTEDDPAKIASQIRQSKQKAAQRNEWLAKSEGKNLEQGGILEETSVAQRISRKPYVDADNECRVEKPVLIMYQTPTDRRVSSIIAQRDNSILDSPSDEGYSPNRYLSADSSVTSDLGLSAATDGHSTIANSRGEDSTNSTPSKSKTLPLYLHSYGSLPHSREPESRTSTLKSDITNHENPKEKKSKKKGIRIPSFSKRKK